MVVQQEAAKMVFDANDASTIITNLDLLYTNAISLLTTYTFGVVALIGIIIPALVTYIQWRTLKTEKESLSLHISNEISSYKIILKQEIMEELIFLIEAKEAELNDKYTHKFDQLQSSIECSFGQGLHVQGSTNLENKNYALASRNFAQAALRFLKGGDELNIRRVLDSLNMCLPKITKAQYKEKELERLIDKLLHKLDLYNIKGRYQDAIRDLSSLNNKVKSLNETS